MGIIIYTVPPCQKLVFYLQEVSLADVHLERLVDDGKPLQNNKYAKTLG
jgi:hypothetical protein